MKKDILWSLEVSDGRIRNKIVGTDHDNAEDIAAIVSYFFDFCRELFPDNNFLIHNINKFLSVIPPRYPLMGEYG